MKLSCGVIFSIVPSSVFSSTLILVCSGEPYRNLQFADTQSSTSRFSSICWTSYSTHLLIPLSGEKSGVLQPSQAAYDSTKSKITGWCKAITNGQLSRSGHCCAMQLSSESHWISRIRDVVTGWSIWIGSLGSFEVLDEQADNYRKTRSIPKFSCLDHEPKKG